LYGRLGVLPLELNRLLIIVVVLSMALTPFLNELGRNAAEYIEVHFEDASSKDVCFFCLCSRIRAPSLLLLHFLKALGNQQGDKYMNSL
jgi:hypothetical protein